MDLNNINNIDIGEEEVEENSSYEEIEETIEINVPIPHPYEEYYKVRDQVLKGELLPHTILHLSPQQYNKYFLKDISYDVEITLVQMAIYMSDYKLFDFLLTTNLDVRVSTRYSELPLMSAILKRNGHFVEEIINGGGEINERSEVRINGYRYYCSPLELAVMKNESDIANLLISRGSYVNITNPLFNVSTLYLAAQRSSYETIQILLKWDADVNIPAYMPRKSGSSFSLITETPVSSVIKRGVNVKALKLMLRNLRININYIDNLGFSYLHYAIFMSKNPEMVACILDAGIDISVPDADDELAIEYRDPSDETCEQSVNIVRGHVVKMIVADFDMCKRNMLGIHGIEFDDFPSKCYEEVQKMKDYCLYRSELTAYQLLHLSMREAAKKLEDVDVTYCLYRRIIKDFPIYAGMINYRLDRARRYSLGHYS